MSKEILMQFVGFESNATAREYTFMVRDTSAEPREFTIAINLRAFNAHLVRFQDAPDVCALKLRRELAASENHPPESHFQITDAELEDYRSSHTSPKRGAFARRPPAEEY
jgi:hypothetical protein